MYSPSSSSAQIPSVSLLLDAWSDCYTVNLSSLSNRDVTADLLDELATLAAWDRRWETSTKLSRQAISAKCQLASSQVQAMQTAMPAVSNFQDVQQLSEIAIQIYLEVADVYQQPADLAGVRPASRRSASTSNDKIVGRVPVEPLAARLEPLFLSVQRSYSSGQDWRSLCDLTLLLTICNRLILKNLSKAEQILLSPYLQFAQEQAVLPWRRLCHSVDRYDRGHLRVTAAKYGISKSQAIAHHVQTKVSHQLRKNDGGYGLFDNPDSPYPPTQNIEMVQAYFWLSVMQNSMTPVEQELVPLCTNMCLITGGSYETVIAESRILVNEILSSLNYAQLDLVEPYAAHFIETLVQNQSQLTPLWQLPQVKSQPAKLKNSVTAF